MTVAALLGTNLTVLFVLFSAAALPSFRTKDPSYIDGLWGLGFVVVAVISATYGRGDNRRATLLMTLTAVWGIRLSTYLMLRWRRNGPDPRYVTLLGPDPSPARIWTRVFLTQAAIVTLVALPVQLGSAYPGPLTGLNAVGVLLALAGIGIEATADAQLSRFKRTHAGVMDRGLWAWTRHPNYFGESLTWWGIGLVSLTTPLSAFGLLGPAVITAFLLTRSGIGPLETHLSSTKPQYAAYITRTSAFFPVPPRRTSPD